MNISDFADLSDNMNESTPDNHYFVKDDLNVVVDNEHFSNKPAVSSFYCAS